MREGLKKYLFDIPTILKIVGIILLLTSIMINLYKDSFTRLVIICLLIIYLFIFIIDYQYKIIPDTLNILILLLSLTQINSFLNITKFDVQLGILFFISLFFFLNIIEIKINKTLIGGGDLKFFLSNVIIFGFSRSILAIFIASIMGLIIEGLIKKNKNKEFAFGPYLVVGYLLIIFINNSVINNLFFV